MHLKRNVDRVPPILPESSKSQFVEPTGIQTASTAPHPGFCDFLVYFIFNLSMRHLCWELGALPGAGGQVSPAKKPSPMLPEPGPAVCVWGGACQGLLGSEPLPSSLSSMSEVKDTCLSSSCSRTDTD